MPEKNISQEIRLKKIAEIRNYLFKETNLNELLSKKHRKLSTFLNYIAHLLIVISTITECVSISAFAFLLGIPISVTSSGIGLKICAITSGIKK